MSLIRKHAALWALLSCFALAAAAPYLIPTNPDSAVFRSRYTGNDARIGLLLPHLSGSFVCGQTPFCQRAGLWFSICRRSEYRLRAVCLRWLLRGTGSLIRRLAVPVLAAPALGSLCRKAALRTRTAENRQTPASAGLGICALSPALLASRFAGVLPRGVELRFPLAIRSAFGAQLLQSPSPAAQRTEQRLGGSGRSVRQSDARRAVQYALTDDRLCLCAGV